MLVSVVRDGVHPHYQYDPATQSQLEYVVGMREAGYTYVHVGGCAVPGNIKSVGGMFGAGEVNLPLEALLAALTGHGIIPLDHAPPTDKGLAAVWWKDISAIWDRGDNWGRAPAITYGFWASLTADAEKDMQKVLFIAAAPEHVRFCSAAPGGRLPAFRVTKAACAGLPGQYVGHMHDIISMNRAADGTMAEMIAGIVMETLRHYVLARVQAAGTADTPHGKAAARIGDMNARGVPTFVTCLPQKVTIHRPHTRRTLQTTLGEKAPKKVTDGITSILYDFAIYVPQCFFDIVEVRSAIEAVMEGHMLLIPTRSEVQMVGDDGKWAVHGAPFAASRHFIYDIDCEKAAPAAMINMLVRAIRVLVSPHAEDAVADPVAKAAHFRTSRSSAVASNAFVMNSPTPTPLAEAHHQALKRLESHATNQGCKVKFTMQRKTIVLHIHEGDPDSIQLWLRGELAKDTTAGPFAERVRSLWAFRPYVEDLSVDGLMSNGSRTYAEGRNGCVQWLRRKFPDCVESGKGNLGFDISSASPAQTQAMRSASLMLAQYMGAEPENSLAMVVAHSAGNENAIVLAGGAAKTGQEAGDVSTITTATSPTPIDISTQHGMQVVVGASPDSGVYVSAASLQNVFKRAIDLEKQNTHIMTVLTKQQEQIDKINASAAARGLPVAISPPPDSTDGGFDAPGGISGGDMRT